MLDHTPDNDVPANDGAEPPATPPAKAARRTRAAAGDAATKAPAKRAPRKTAAKKAAPPAPDAGADPAAGNDQAPAPDQPPVIEQPAVIDQPAAPTDPAGQPTAAGLPDETPAPAKKATRARKAPAKKAAGKAAGRAAAAEPASDAEVTPAVEQAAAPSQPTLTEQAVDAGSPAEAGEPATRQPAKRAPRKRVSKAAAAAQAAADLAAADLAAADLAGSEQGGEPSAEAPSAAPVLASPPVVLFQPPAAEPAPPRRRRGSKRTAPEPEVAAVAEEPDTLDELSALIDPDADLEPEDVDTDDLGTDDPDSDEADDSDSDEAAGEGTRRRRRRGRRGRGNRSPETGAETGAEADAEPAADLGEDDDEPEEDHADEVAEAALSASARRRRRRRRSSGADGEAAASEDDPPNTVVHVRDSRAASRDGRDSRGSAADDDGVRGVKGSTRLEAKRQRRRDNRDTGRRRAPILTEAEFLARREAVDRVMAVRQTGDRTQIAVLEDDILVEHYVTRASASSAVGNVYLGRVQNVLPSMEAAFVDIGRGRNGVLYAGEVNWDTAGLEGKSRSIENALSAGDLVLVQVTKDPIGHKGARLTSQISLPGRFVVYVPGGGMTGISRKLPDVERSRLKAILKKVVPDEAGVIVRTAAEGASEQDLVSDVERLKAEWESISAKAAKAKQSSDHGPSLLHGEPDLAIRVVRDIFNDDFKKLVVAGAEIHRTISDYVRDIAPDLADRISRHTAESDLFRDLRVDEQLAKALDRKVWLPSGGSLVIDRTEAMTVVDVNTGKYTGSGGNLEQTVTRNNLEAAEEIVRQLRLRDIGGIVVIDFIDMVLESNRELVLRRLTECLGRDRTKHQVAEVTSLGLVQMTRKRVGEGLLEAFSEPCSTCGGRGVIVHLDGADRKSNGAAPASAPAAAEEDRPARGRRGRKATKAESAPAQPDAAELAAEAEKRRAAASAVAAIAAATGHHDEAGRNGAADRNSETGHHAEARHHGADRNGSEPAGSGREAGTGASDAATSGTADASPAASDGGASGTAEPATAPTRRTRTPRRAVRQATAPAPATEAAPTVTSPAAGPAASDAAPAGSTAAAAPPAVITQPATTQPAATQPAAGQPDGAQPVRPRRRRAASRPAGPPVPVSVSEE